MLHRLVIAALLLLPALSFAQNAFNAKNISQQELPATVMVKGSFTKALQWTDKSGEHIIVYSGSATKNGSTLSAELYAHCYTLKGSSASLDWKVQDFEKDCEFDIMAAFMMEAFQITDLDKDGMAEVWMIYKTSCKSDVSPDNMKLIMYEGKQKHAMRGQSKVQISEHDYFGGNYTFDNTFNKASESFRKEAEKLWKKFVLPV